MECCCTKFQGQPNNHEGVLHCAGCGWPIPEHMLAVLAHRPYEPEWHASLPEGFTGLYWPHNGALV